MSRKATDTDLAIAKNVRALRLRAGRSQEWLGDVTGVTFQQIQKYENGTNRLSGGQIKKIADALDVSVADIFDDTTARDVSIERAVAEVPVILNQAIEMQARLSAAIQVLQGSHQ
jgi:transcriptional regulator with XRE-family HTH domain